MKRLFLLSSLLYSYFSYAQVVTTIKGLKTIEFVLSNGKIRVYLPADMYEGEQINGSIGFEPNGEKERHRTKAMEELLKTNIKIGDQSQQGEPLTKRFNSEHNTGILPPVKVTSPFAISLTGTDGRIQTVPIDVSGQGPAKTLNSEPCLIPTHALTLAPFRIIGNFDGDASNTKLSINNKPGTILSESPRQVIMLYPGNLEDLAFMHVQEKGQEVCVQNISSVVINIKEGKSSLRKGEKGWIECIIKGLEKLKTPATLTVINKSRDDVKINDGDEQSIKIEPPKDIEKYIFQKRWDLEGLKPGSHTISIHLDIPEQYSHVPR